jgi:putative transposase
MQKLSLTFTQYSNKKYKRTGRLWECRFYSSIIDKESYLLSVCRYIEKNPVRAKVIENPLRYKWSSAKYILSGDGAEWLEPAWADCCTKDEYIKFLNQQEDAGEVEKIRRSVFKGMPLGPAKFIKKLSEESGILLTARPRGRPRKNK